MFVAPKNLFQLVRVSVDSLWNTFQAISDTSPMSAELLLTGFFSLFFRLPRFRLRRRIRSTLEPGTYAKSPSLTLPVRFISSAGYAVCLLKSCFPSSFFSEVMNNSYPNVGCEGIHIDRAAGGDCDHRHPGGPASSCCAEGTRSRSSHTVQKQSQADWNCTSQLPRHISSVSTRYSASSPGSKSWASARELRNIWLGCADTSTAGADQWCPTTVSTQSDAARSIDCGKCGRTAERGISAIAGLSVSRRYDGRPLSERDAKNALQQIVGDWQRLASTDTELSGIHGRSVRRSACTLTVESSPPQGNFLQQQCGSFSRHHGWNLEHLHGW